MDFAERIVAECRKAMSEGIANERHIRDIVRLRTVDVQPLECFLKSDNEMVRRAAVRIFAGRKIVKPLIEMAAHPESREMLLEILQSIGTTDESMELLGKLLVCEDTIVRDEAIELFRRTGNLDNLFPLVFSKDESMVQRIKRYFYETGRFQE
jgi:hypothetical protein